MNLSQIQEILTDCNYDLREARQIALWLLEEYGGLSAMKAITNQEVTEEATMRIEFALEKLREGMPIQQVIQKAHFYSLELFVNQDVLIPRPETEELVRWILDDNNKDSIQVWDLCSGSGCIALALSSKRGFWDIKGFEVSDPALYVSNRNAKTLCLKVKFEKSNVLNLTEFYGNVDVIVSNPPYIPIQEIRSMDKKVVDYEPTLALFVPDSDPLVFYKSIKEIALRCLKVGGAIYFETHSELLDQTADIFNEDEWLATKKADLTGRPRMLKVVRVK